MSDSNLIIDLKIELSIPEKEGGKYTISVGGANLYKVENDKLIPLDVTVSGKLRGAGGGGDKPRGAGGIGDKLRGAGGVGDKPRGAGGAGDKPRGAGGAGDKPRGASGAGDKPKGTAKATAKTKKAK